MRMMMIDDVPLEGGRWTSGRTIPIVCDDDSN